MDNNVYIFYHLILKLGLHEGQCRKKKFIFNIVNKLDIDSQLNKLHELKKMNQQQIVCDKVRSQFSDYITL